VFTLSAWLLLLCSWREQPRLVDLWGEAYQRIAARHGNGIQKKQHQIQRRLIACVPDYDKYNSSSGTCWLERRPRWSPPSPP
jgi:hypothetical protein